VPGFTWYSYSEPEKWEFLDPSKLWKDRFGDFDALGASRVVYDFGGGVDKMVEG
jgi:hypothetical protein